MARIAIVGGGIAGLYSCWRLAKNHQVTLYEADQRLGGHTDTHQLSGAAGALSVDSGFIVFNPAHYPLFCAMLADLGVRSQVSAMSFSVYDERNGMEYCASPSLASLFARKANLLSPTFYRMLFDIRRFYTVAENARHTLSDDVTLGEFLDQEAYSTAFADWHLVPMAAALWSASYRQIRDYPMRYLLAFMHNHCMLQLRDRPQWQTVAGGSSRYVEALREKLPVAFRVGDAVTEVQRNRHSVQLRSEGHEAEYDALVIACHSDQALRLLGDASAVEASVLGDIGYESNEMLLHCDPTVMPRRRRVWGSWNALIEDRDSARCTVSYYMNHLQQLAVAEDYIVSLNLGHRVRPDCVMARRQYHHPQYTPTTIAAQQRWAEISGQRRTWYAGAYWGWGFHEDGARSAERAVTHLEQALAE